MTFHKITSVEPLHYPVVQVTFEDGVSGELDLGETIGSSPFFAPLRDEAYFRTVAVAERGRSFGWDLDQPGREIDFCADAIRIQVETQLVEELAARYRDQRSAAE